MIADCEDGKIDLVITKSISRFARNTQDCLAYSRKLKNLGIGIIFEKENINTLDSTGELLFTILSSLAQDESRNISENCKWGIRTKFKKLVKSIQDDPEMLELRELIVYDTQDERGFVIIGGNMRYEALRKLKYKTAVCKILPHDFPMDKMRRIVLKDNSSFGETNFDDLINDWKPEEIDAAAIDVPDIPDPEEEEEAKDDGYDVAGNTAARKQGASSRSAK